MSILEVRDLVVDIPTEDGPVHAVKNVSFDVREGEFFGIVGESGSGKSVLVQSAMGLIPNAKTSGEVIFKGENLLRLSGEQLRRKRGKEISMVFQDPLSSLHPQYSIGWQIVEQIRAHEKVSKEAAKARAIELLGKVHIPDPASRFDAYPHQFSGGMRQRVMIAMSLSLGPSLIIADEPTTALDSTVQAQILDLLAEMQQDMGATVLMISHDLGVMASVADRVMVMYQGNQMEIGESAEVFSNPQDPYTMASNLLTDGSFTYTPDAGFVGSEVLTYTVSDGITTRTGTVTIVVENEAPAVQDETYTVHAGDVLAVGAAAGLLANDSDLDGDALQVVNFTPPSNGTMNLLTDGSFTYTPDAGFVGSEVLTYTVSDGITTRTGTVTIVVENEAPVVQDETYTVHTGNVLTVGAAAGLLANDSDLDGDALQVLNFTPPSNGTMNLLTDGSFTYTPDAGFVGSEVLTYTVSDGPITSTGEVTINVTPTVEPTIIRIGDATGIASPVNPHVWAPFWTDAAVDITHKAAYTNAAESWTPVLLTASGSAVLSGGDLNGGDLGVSGRALATSTVAQEISGAEALRFDLESPAARATVDLTRLFVGDDGNASGFVEAGRLQALDNSGNVVAEIGFVADRSDGTKDRDLVPRGGIQFLGRHRGCLRWQRLRIRCLCGGRWQFRGCAV